MTNILCAGLFFPFIGFLILLVTSSVISRRLAGLVACFTILGSFLCFLYLLIVDTNVTVDPIAITLFKWIPVDGINADFSLYIDSLSTLMTLIITGIGFLIHVYSIGYMNHDKDYARYFACLNFFVFAMLLLVLAGNLLVLFVGWEGVGLASYLLIGFWYYLPVAAQAATKAFIVNRIGDLGLLLGILLTYYLFGTSDIVEISKMAPTQFAIGAPIITLLTLLYFIGAVGKSAQLPLHTWLPDAMAGPTPVSALIHAATMVTAGVYLVVRLHVLFSLAPTTLMIIGIVGGATSLFAALSAAGQTDLKRVLAYSTVSQLGLMFLACGIGAYYSAMFHLTTHAFTKALLFLTAGNVVHMMHGTTEMEKMGGLAKIFKKTHWLFLIGVLALSGLPPFSPFFSKDLILEQELESGHKILFYVGLATSILTAFYLTRAYILTFYGTPRHHGVIKEAPAVMITPNVFLAFAAIFGGVLGFAFGHAPILTLFLGDLGITSLEKHVDFNFMLSLETLIATGGALLGLVAGAVIYTCYADRLTKPFAILKKSFYIDEIYWYGIVVPLRSISVLVEKYVEPILFDGSVKVISKTAQKTSYLLQTVQSGQIRSYVAWMVLGTAFIIVYFVF